MADGTVVARGLQLSMRAALISTDPMILERISRSRPDGLAPLCAVPSLEDLKQQPDASSYRFVLIDCRTPAWSEELAACSSPVLDEPSVVVLTLSNTADERVKALTRGADEAVWRHVDPTELWARLYTLRRLTTRVKLLAASEARVRVGALTFFPANRVVVSDQGGRTCLSDANARLFVALLLADPESRRAEVLAGAGRRANPEGAIPKDINVQVHRLRSSLRKLDHTADPIECVRGLGYRLNV